MLEVGHQGVGHRERWAKRRKTRRGRRKRNGKKIKGDILGRSRSIRGQKESRIRNKMKVGQG